MALTVHLTDKANRAGHSCGAAPGVKPNYMRFRGVRAFEMLKAVSPIKAGQLVVIKNGGVAPAKKSL